MSYRALNWAWEMDLPSTRKFVLIALADMADENESCFPGQERIARMVGLSSRAVRDAVAWLESAGLLTREKRYREDGTRGTDRYRLRTDRAYLAPMADPEPEPDADVDEDATDSDYRNEVPVDYRNELPVELPEADAGLPEDDDRYYRNEVPGYNHQKNHQITPSARRATTPNPQIGGLEEPNIRKRRKALPLPASWAPTSDHYQRAKASHLDIAGEAERFRLHAETHDRRTANWNAAFTTWLMKSAERAPALPPSSAPQEHYAWLRQHRITEDEWQALASEHGARDARQIVEGRSTE